jgi:spore coat protein U-like protein
MRKTTLLIALASLAAAGTATAGSASGQFDVTANVQGSCRVVAAPTLAFGTYDPAVTHATTPKDAQSSISVRCVKGMTADVALGEGAHAGTGSTCAAPARRMLDATSTELLAYDIYQDSNRTSVWGCATANDRGFTAAASTTDTVLDTYGRIPAGQNVGLGTDFRDTVVVTVTF